MKPKELIDQERQPCEVWTRVMGYYRPVSEFNRGKKAEHQERQNFSENKAIYCQLELEDAINNTKKENR